MFKFLKGLIKNEKGSEFVEKLIVIAAVVALGAVVATFIYNAVKNAGETTPSGLPSTITPAP